MSEAEHIAQYLLATEEYPALKLLTEIRDLKDCRAYFTECPELKEDYDKQIRINKIAFKILSSTMEN